MKKSYPGFTIVELLIVIVVIGILAAITIVSYNGITGQAVDASMKTDLQGAATSLALDSTNGNGYPSSASAANSGQGLKSSGDNQLTYNGYGTGYCISISNVKRPNTFRISSISGLIETGSCGIIASTYAGSTTWGYLDGPSASARFNAPQGVAIGNNGIVYVADAGCYCIRQISTTGTVSTLAGGTFGTANGTGSAAQFIAPSGVAVGPNGDIYVADSAGLIRVITPAGTVSTLAGANASSFADSPTGSLARFYNPQGIAVDGTGTVYVADTGNNRIRKVSSAGAVTTLAGSTEGFAEGTGSAARFNSPSDVTVSSSGTVYVTDWVNQRIRSISPAGAVTTFAGSSAAGSIDGTGASAQFFYPISLAIATDGSLYSGDERGAIRKITPGAVVTTIAGNAGSGFADGPAAQAKFDYPYGLTVDGSGTIYIADSENNRIRKVVQ